MYKDSRTEERNLADTCIDLMGASEDWPFTTTLMDLPEKNNLITA